MTTLTVTINGRTCGPRQVRDELSMNDFLRKYLGMTGTKFGCGAAQRLSCAVITGNPDGTSYTSPTCMVAARASTVNRSARRKAPRWGSHLLIGWTRSRSMTRSGACPEALGSIATSGVRGQCCRRCPAHLRRIGCGCA